MGTTILGGQHLSRHKFVGVNKIFRTINFWGSTFCEKRFWNGGQHHFMKNIFGGHNFAETINV